MRNTVAFAIFALFACMANAQSAAFLASETSCQEFRLLLAEAKAGSTATRSLEATAYRNALIDAFSWYYGRGSVEQEMDRVLERCDTTVSHAAQRLSENIFYEFEYELRTQIEYESE